MVDRMADYLANLDRLPVRSQVEPGALVAALPAEAPEMPEAFADILADVDRLIVPGLTHWQHPRFFAYFQANASPPSLLGEMLTATFAQQAMLWETSPAANELEAVIMSWLRRMIGLPDTFTGTIQDSGSSSNLIALLVARERALGWRGDREGLSGLPSPVAYTSSETHSSVAKAARIAGYGQSGSVAVPVDAELRMDPAALDRAVREDTRAGRLPACVVATFGTTGTGAMDPIDAIADVCEEHGLFLHVDAAWAGSALILPEVRATAAGIERADSVMFNPHKWLLTHFDFSAHFVRSPRDLVRTLHVLPAYLETESESVVPDYRDWTIPLGRRFRALKAWFVLRYYGSRALQEMIRRHIKWANDLEQLIHDDPNFEIVTPRSLSLVTFRFHPNAVDAPEADRLTEALVRAVNDDGFAYLTRTTVDGRPVIRFVVGQTNTTWTHVAESWARVQSLARGLVS